MSTHETTQRTPTTARRILDGASWCDWASPVGPLRLVHAETGLRAIWFRDAKHCPDVSNSTNVPSQAASKGFEDVKEQLCAYFAGDRERFELRLDPIGTEFQREVWTRLQQIPFGETRTYSQLAGEIGRSKAVRAVAAANARNPLSIVIPCHRVIGSDGRLTGYAGGVDRKRRLLDLERGQSVIKNEA